MPAFQLRPIRTRRDHERALAEIERLWEARPGSPDGDRLEVLTILVEKYEEETFPFEAPDPVAAIRFRMEQLGMEQSALAKVVGSRSRASEILNRKRPLSLATILKLHEKLSIPLESLIPGTAR